MLKQEECNYLMLPNEEYRRVKDEVYFSSKQFIQKLSQTMFPGIKDVDKVKRQQERAAKQDKLEMDAAKMGNSPSLKWQSN